jgi:cell fate regulator YaaT (PSP1 superfamily)
MIEETKNIAAVRFTKVGKLYHFDASNIAEIKVGDVVVVETSRGQQLGEVAQVLQNSTIPNDMAIKPIDRVATPRDLVIRQSWQQKETEALAYSRSRVTELGIGRMKVITAEYSLDGSRLTVLFSTEAEEKVDLKSLRQDVQRLFSPAQVELRQIGPRDVAKVVGGMGACGMETRCCSRFLTDFSSISIKMAKEQGISLTPAEITGMCGRLRCCLVYEYELYVEARKELPKRNKRVITPQGEGKVVDVSPLRGTVFVEIPELGVREFPKDDLQPAQELENLERKAQAPCPAGNEGCRGENIKIPENQVDDANSKPVENRSEGEKNRPFENRRDGGNRRGPENRRDGGENKRDGERGDRKQR